MRGFPTLRVLPAGPTSAAVSAFLWMVLSEDVLCPFKDRNGSPRSFAVSLCPYHALRPRRSLQPPRLLRWLTCAFQAFDPVGLRLFSRGSIASLALRSRQPLSTLSLCRCLHKPKTRFPVEWLCSFPERDSHPLKTPSLSWRPKETLDVEIEHPIVTPTTLPRYTKGFNR